MSDPDAWYVVKRPEGTCDILPGSPTDSTELADDAASNGAVERWGPFASEAEATARRVGLIRAGKCRPV